MDKAYTGGDVIVSFEKLSEAYGIAYDPISSVEMVRLTVEKALVSGRLSLIEIDMTAIGPFRIPFAGYALNN